MLWVVQMIRGCDLRVGMSATSAREPQSDRVRLETPRARHLTRAATALTHHPSLCSSAPLVRLVLELASHFP